MIWFIFSIFRLVTAQQQMKSESEASFSSLEVCCCWFFFSHFWGHFRVSPSLRSCRISIIPIHVSHALRALKEKKRKTSDRRISFPKSLLSAKPLVWNFFSSDVNETHYHKKGFALSLVLKVRVSGTRKWPIPPFSSVQFSSVYSHLYTIFTLYRNT